MLECLCQLWLWVRPVSLVARSSFLQSDTLAARTIRQRLVCALHVSHLSEDLFLDRYFSPRHRIVNVLQASIFLPLVHRAQPSLLTGDPVPKVVNIER